METRSLKTLSIRVLQRNQEGNQKETVSFPDGNSEETTQAQGQVVKQAEGFGCGACGNNIYRQTTDWTCSPLPSGIAWQYEHRPEIGWKCETCGAVYPIIGGSRGPIHMH